MEIRYEDLISQGEKIIVKILDFLDLENYKEFSRSIPKLKKNICYKWRKEFSKQQINEIHPILAPMLIKLGYEDEDSLKKLNVCD